MQVVRSMLVKQQQVQSKLMIPLTTCIKIEVDGHQFVAQMANVHYWIGQHNITAMEHALVDCSANGGICGDDMLVLEGSERFVDVSGLAGHKVSQIHIVSASALVIKHKGDAIATYHQMALLGTG
jgi:hypothetical protein